MTRLHVRVEKQARTNRAPIEIPVAPKPATARPMMRQSEFGAAAHNIEPISKTATEAIKHHFMLYWVYSFPKINCEQHEVNRYADPYQPMSESE